MESTLFTALSTNEEATLSGGKIKDSFNKNKLANISAFNNVDSGKDSQYTSADAINNGTIKQ
ncbi:hypothetical protein [Nostoc sp.]|uniref:hypothetical protein n=1 Tax=Nostoc sp. TaxID=1180 RepID=UPI002FF83317